MPRIQCPPSGPAGFDALGVYTLQNKSRSRWPLSAGNSLLATAAVIALAGCGTSQSLSDHAAAGKTGSASALPTGAPISLSRKPATPRFLIEINSVCQAVRQDAPQALRGSYSPATVQRYARSAQPAARRTAVSLQRLAAVGDGPKLQAIATGYLQLQAAYGSAGLARTPHLARQVGTSIQEREQFVTAAARAAGAPACGVAGR